MWKNVERSSSEQRKKIIKNSRLNKNRLEWRWKVSPNQAITQAILNKNIYLD